MHITLKQLEVFTTVAEQLNITHAAKILNMTQPAVSIQIKNLERQLGINLIEFVGKKLMLTDAGIELLKDVADIQSSVVQLTTTADRLKGILGGSLKISIAPGAYQRGLFNIINAFSQKHPAIKFKVEVPDRLSQLRLLQENKIDFCIMGSPPEKSLLQAQKLFDYNSVVIAQPKHPLVGKKNISIEMLSKEKWVVGELYSNSRRILERLVLKKTTEVIHVNNADSLKYAVEAGLGLTVLSAKILDKELMNKHYAILDVEGFPIVEHVYLVNRHKKLLSPASLAFQEFAVKYCQQHIKNE